MAKGMWTTFFEGDFDGLIRNAHNGEGMSMLSSDYATESSTDEHSITDIDHATSMATAEEEEEEGEVSGWGRGTGLPKRCKRR